MRPEQIPYGVKDFKRIRLENFCYVDKTSYVRELDELSSEGYFPRATTERRFQ